MGRLLTRPGKTLGGLALLLILLVAGVGWWQYGALRAWYSVHGLTIADDRDRESWVSRVVALDEDGLPRLLCHLEKQDPCGCANVHMALARLAERWGPTDSRRDALAARLLEVYPRLSLGGQRCVLELLTEWLNTAPTGPVVQAAVRALPLGSRAPDKDVRSQTLVLASSILAHAPHEEGVNACRELVGACLKDDDAGNRAEAIRVAVHPHVGLARLVGPLLDDPAAEVRLTAMLAVGGASEDAIATDDLLRSLHDPDAEVRQTCEEVLTRTRGLRAQDVSMARLVTDAKAAIRLQVLERLSRTDLDAALWLRRLSHDPVPAVRAAAVRAAAEHAQVDFSDRLEKMAQNDPSPTVRQLAQYYLARQKFNVR